MPKESYQPKSRAIPSNDKHNYYFKTMLCGSFVNEGFKGRKNYAK